jgi:hypothetical protein
VRSPTGTVCVTGTDPTVRTPECARGTEFLKFRIESAECWDGKRLDSADHKSHMAYADRGECPRSHPVAVPGMKPHRRSPAKLRDRASGAGVRYPGPGPGRRPTLYGTLSFSTPT